MISQNTIQQILSKLDIVDTLGDFIKLKKRGANYLGLCPFHNERTPSFTVSPAKEIYKCFGCGKSGNTISFLMEHEKYSYVDSLIWLANKYGIEVEETFQSDAQKQTQQTADSLFIINIFAQKFFTKSLLDSAEGKNIGLSYLKERGFREDIILKFQLGYSSEQSDSFTQEASRQQFNSELLIKTGLVISKNDSIFDNYRGRIIFPIHNHSGKILGFGARILKSNDKAPKYINTPENEIYVKGKILYGSYFSRQAIDKADECLLVEGYTDVISLHQAGIENVVASGGTALTPDQLRLVKKYSKNLTIIYDGDAAGIKAALRGLDLALEEGLNVKLVLLPEKEDPDSYVHKVGTAEFSEFISKNKKDVVLFQLEIALKDVGTDSVKKAAIVNQIAESISKINKVEDFTKQQDYIKQCAQILKIDEEGLHTLVNKFIRNRISIQEKLLPFEEAKLLEENAKKASASNYDDATFNLLFKDELQEKEFARVLMEHGNKSWKDSTIAEYMLSEILDESLFDNTSVIQFLKTYKEIFQTDRQSLAKNIFIYHTDQSVSTLAVSLCNNQYEESGYWKKEYSQDEGYQQKFFENSYEDFIKLIGVEKETELRKYLKMQEDTTFFEVESCVNYFKLRKLKRMLLENQLDLQNAKTEEETEVLMQTHIHLKKMEIEISEKIGGVIIK